MYGEIQGTGFDRIDPRFDACLTGHGRVERLWSGARWLEGPVWFAAGRYLLISDIPNNRLLRWDDTDDSMSVFRNPSNYCNGNTIDQQGRLITCEHLTRRVTRTEHDGSIRVLADEFNGKRLNSPNDVVVKSDGSVWFTDPTYGILSDYEGRRAPAEQSGCHVYRIDPETSDIKQVTRDFMQPNGLAFDADETALFISDTGASHAENGPKHIRKFSLCENGQTLGESTVFAECSAGLFDGFRFDTAGRLWSSAADGVHCYDPDGTLIGKILIPEMVANLCFGGAARNRLFISGTTSLYAAYLNVNGA